MKQRMLVMNGSRIIEAATEAGTWSVLKVEKAGELKPGIYNLFAAQKAAKDGQFVGPVIHADAQSVYQKTGSTIVIHDRAAFTRLPELGVAKCIEYGADGMVHVASAAQHSRSISR